jgi:hypothetical protein
MFQNDPMLWSYSAKDREQTLLQEAEEYRRAKRIGENQLAQARPRLVIVLAVVALVISGIAWVFVG